ncbi:hypothetical protein [Cryptosporangium aurantiacum]|uniref:Copper resistance protein D n=1 Tax=Cryptosporangium aurantiacum TaxID=134849 RepID=A0A1M7RPZ8_9ACTN|nr:hypothetical protein [Cryptosporangium aurantiacum]SHN48241.1 hypothetical protein SAMN05443668_13813 [Cryptosporangium aurantiacum]
MAVLTWGFAMIHLGIAAVWLGSMAYSLRVVQPALDRAIDDLVRREELVTTLAQGNRWRVVGLIGGVIVSGSAVALLADGSVTIGYAVAVGLYLVAAAIFANVSWRHWPARVFALPDEIPRFRQSLRRQATTMLGLVGCAYGVALGVTTASGAVP